MKAFEQMMLPAILFSIVASQTSSDLTSACDNMVSIISGTDGCVGDASGNVCKNNIRVLLLNGFEPRFTTAEHGMLLLRLEGLMRRFSSLKIILSMLDFRVVGLIC
jgi:hypothetical protein